MDWNASGLCGKEEDKWNLGRAITPRRSLISAPGCALATRGRQVGFSMRNSEGVAQPIETSATPSELHETNVPYIPGLPERNPGLEIRERFQR